MKKYLFYTLKATLSILPIHFTTHSTSHLLFLHKT